MNNAEKKICLEQRIKRLKGKEVNSKCTGVLRKLTRKFNKI